MSERSFLCLSSFESEGRYCYENEIYTAYQMNPGWKFVFENGEMNFVTSLFEETILAWSDVLREIY